MFKEFNMMKRDENGNILEVLPETAKKIDGMELLVIPNEGALSEYSPEAYNSVNMFFVNSGYKSFVDNFCDREWMQENKGLEINEIKNICKIATEKGDEKEGEIVSNLIKEKITESDEKIYKSQIENETTLNICVPVGKKTVHLELPYCTIEKIYKL